MKKTPFLILLIFLNACVESTKETLTAQQIIDESIAISGGELHNEKEVSFLFRGIKYISEPAESITTLKRIITTDSITITDVKKGDDFKRYYDATLATVADTLASAYANSINSVHYFARLPFGLNAPAVKKELLGTQIIKNKEYYKIKVTFSEDNGGDDFDDTYLYWFNKETFKPDYLAYEFHVDGGGKRFRAAYNERNVNGIRFVDYKNLKPKDKTVSIFKIDSLFEVDALTLLSKIELDSIKVKTIN